ncbi:MAG: DUF4388 domain-containing protein [Thermoleophilia bacterium]
MGLKGTFFELPLPDLVEMAALGRKTGRLVVYDARGAASGELSLCAGRVVGARCRGLAAEKAFYALLAVTDGSFDFDPSAQLGEETCDLPAGGLLMEAMRRLDEVRRLRRAWPAGTRVRGRAAGEASAGQPEGEVEALALTALGSSRADLAELAVALVVGTGADEYEAWTALRRLEVRGLLAVEVPEAGVAGEAPST